MIAQPIRHPAAGDALHGDFQDMRPGWARGDTEGPLHRFTVKVEQQGHELARSIRKQHRSLADQPEGFNVVGLFDDVRHLQRCDAPGPERNRGVVIYETGKDGACGWRWCDSVDLAICKQPIDPRVLAASGGGHRAICAAK
ncbi:hypothetical protein D9M73_105740 [compost metagenome]